MLKARLLASWTIGLTAVLVAAPCQAQGNVDRNIDRGKTPAQAFADTCAGCHRSPRAFKRASAAFLRLHYVASAAEASAMAAYLAGLPREQAPKRPPPDGVETRAETANPQAKQQPIAQTADRAETTPSQPSSDPSLASTPPPKPVLEPFEE